jgi:hypothetical protein
MYSREEFTELLKSIEMPENLIEFILWKNCSKTLDMESFDGKYFLEVFIKSCKKSLKPAVKALLHAIIDYMHQQELNVLKLRD